MKALDKIYVHRTVHLGLLSASEIDITGSDEQYIRKEALMEWANERRKDLFNWHYHDEKRCWAVYDEIIEKLNSM